MTGAEFFSSLFPAEYGSTVVIDDASFATFSAVLLGAGADDVDRVEAMNVFLAQAQKESGDLASKSGGWVLHLSRAAAQSAILTTVLTLSLKAVTQTDLSLVILPAVLPLLFQIERSELSLRDQELLACLYRKVGSGARSAQELLDAVPAELKAEINRLDLLDFLQHLKMTGHANEAGDNTFTLRHPDRPQFTVHIR